MKNKSSSKPSVRVLFIKCDSNFINSLSRTRVLETKASRYPKDKSFSISSIGGQACPIPLHSIEKTRSDVDGVKKNKTTY